VNAIAVGRWFTCALETNGGVKCWGSNIYGALGISNTIVSYSSTPLQIPIDTGKTARFLGAHGGSDGSHVCAALNDDSLWCWGMNSYGQLGVATDYVQFTPVRTMPSLTSIVSIVIGGAHTCVQTASATIRCWGWNADNQLGGPWVLGDPATSVADLNVMHPLDWRRFQHLQPRLVR
jgi:alpha-tubulin suppressor-like RCC1 family protein